MISNLSSIPNESYCIPTCGVVVFNSHLLPCHLCNGAGHSMPPHTHRNLSLTGQCRWWLSASFPILGTQQQSHHCHPHCHPLSYHPGGGDTVGWHM